METSILEAGPKPEQRAEVIKKVFDEVDTIVRERHSEGNPYHNEKHPESVDSESKDIFERAKAAGVDVPEEEELARKTAAKTHDIVVRYFIEPDNPFIKGWRVRLRGFEAEAPDNIKALSRFRVIKGNKVEVFTKKQMDERVDAKGLPINSEGLIPMIGNEEASYNEIEALMNKHDPKGGIFTPYIKELIKRGIAATYPYIGFAPFKNQERAKKLIDPALLAKDSEGNPKYEGLLVDQTFLRNRLEKAGLVEIAVGAGDIFYGGKKGFKKFFDASNGEFRESVQWIQDALDQKGLAGLTSNEKVGAAKAVFGWLSTQPGFLLHQEERFEELLQTNALIKNNERFAQGLRDKYAHFEDNIATMQEKVREMKQSYGDLTQESGYPAGDERLGELLGIMGYSLSERARTNGLAA